MRRWGRPLMLMALPVSSRAKPPSGPRLYRVEAIAARPVMLPALPAVSFCSPSVWNGPQALPPQPAPPDADA